MLKYFVAGLISLLLCIAAYFFWQGTRTRDQLELAATAQAPAVLHVIGVYEGESDDREGQRDKLRDCLADAVGDPADLEGEGPAGGVIKKCEKFSQEVEGVIDVEITDRSGPVVLALTANDPILWRVRPDRGVKITKVILGGYHSQRVEGLAPETAVEIHTHEASPPCAQCEQHPDYFHSYESPPEELRSITGMSPTSFQGSYRGRHFAISEHTGRDPGIAAGN